VAGGQIKTFVLSHVIKINKELQTSMTHSPARLPQAFVGGRYFFLCCSRHLNNSSVETKFVNPFFSSPFFNPLSPVQILQRKCFAKATY
jgi:hypothetical protein